jgi:hypothetical protein
VTSCDEYKDIEQDIKTYELKFQNDSQNKSEKKQNIETYEIKFNKNNGEIQFDDSKLILIEDVENKESGNKSFVLIIKEDAEIKKEQRISNKLPLIEVRRGFYYDGECFVYGAY